MRIMALKVSERACKGKIDENGFRIVGSGAIVTFKTAKKEFFSTYVEESTLNILNSTAGVCRLEIKGRGSNRSIISVRPCEEYGVEETWEEESASVTIVTEAGKKGVNATMQDAEAKGGFIRRKYLKPNDKMGIRIMAEEYARPKFTGLYK